MTDHDHDAPSVDEAWLRITDHAGDLFAEHADRTRKAFEQARAGDGVEWMDYLAGFWGQVARDTATAAKNTMDLWSAYATHDEG